MHLEHRFPFRVLFWLLSYTPDWCWRLGATSMMLFQNMVRVSGAGFVTQAKADEVSNFWKSKQAAAAQDVWDSPCYVSYDIPVSFLSGQGHVISKSCVFFFVHWFGLQMPHLLFLCCDKVYQNVQKALAQTVENISSNAKFVDRLTLAKQGARVREYDSGQECLVVEPP